MPLSETKLRELVAADEGQYYDRKSLFEGPSDGKRPRDRRAVRDQIAEQVAGFANADGGIVIFGIEDDHSITGHRYPPDVIESLEARMSEVGHVTNADYREAFGVDRRAATAALSAWLGEGILVREGERRNARYRPGPRWPPR